MKTENIIILILVILIIVVGTVALLMNVGSFSNLHKDT